MTDLVERLRDLSDAYQDLLSQHEELSKRFADMKAFADAMEIKRDKAADEIERLRDEVQAQRECCTGYYNEAADALAENRRLRAALTEITRYTYSLRDGCKIPLGIDAEMLQDIAKEALKEQP